MAGTGFFDRQARARRNTAWLVVLFLVAVTLIALAVCIVGYLVTRSDTTSLSFPHWLVSRHGLFTAAGAIALIGMGSLMRWLDLAGGGDRVARMVGARLLDPSSQDQDERRLRNVVEEMAIAAGIPVPELYIMDQETGVDAFVAGYSPTEAVMVVTHGTLTHLNRDELQGVVGHEFSHILNGDMRLNVRLIALLAGILMIGQVGSFLLTSFQHRSYRSSRRGKEQGAVVILGLALMAIGYVGLFFGRLIQSAVSRQREMLADASSVQFTRNPDGIAGALYKIGLKTGYLETTSHASDMNHMCFGESAKMRFSRLLASHPPIERRIETIQPGMMARLRSRLRDTLPSDKTRLRHGDGQTGPATSAVASFAGSGTPGGAASPSASAGQLNEAGEDYARKLLSQIPATFRELLYTRSGAVQLCYAILTRELPEEGREKQLALVKGPSDFAPQPELLTKLLPTLIAWGGALKLPALEIAMPALRRLDPEEIERLIQNLHKLIKADGRVSLTEFALAGFLQRHLAPGATRVVPVKYRNYRQVRSSLERVFSLVARISGESPEQATALYIEAMAGFAEPSETDLRMPDKTSMRELSAALKALNQLSPLLKPAIIDACGQCILSDRRVTPREYDMLRLVADQLDCPMPPLTVAG